MKVKRYTTIPPGLINSGMALKPTGSFLTKLRQLVIAWLSHDAVGRQVSFEIPSTAKIAPPHIKVSKIVDFPECIRRFRISRENEWLSLAGESLALRSRVSDFMLHGGGGVSLWLRFG